MRMTKSASSWDVTSAVEFLIAELSVVHVAKWDGLPGHHARPTNLHTSFVGTLHLWDVTSAVEFPVAEFSVVHEAFWDGFPGHHARPTNILTSLVEAFGLVFRDEEGESDQEKPLTQHVFPVFSSTKVTFQLRRSPALPASAQS